MKIWGWLVLVTKLILEKSKKWLWYLFKDKNTNLPYPNFFHEISELDDIYFKNQCIMTVSGTHRGVTKLGAKKMAISDKRAFFRLQKIYKKETKN